MGFVGLGKMGKPMVMKLIEAGHGVVAYDLSPERVREVEEAGAVGARSLKEVVERLSPPRVVWVMVPAGDPTARVIEELGQHLSEGDVIVDGGNSNYRDSMARAEGLRGRGVHLLDVGTSGGVWGAERGYCLMVGGERGVYERVKTVFQALAMEEGFAYVGPQGSGHYVKMVHNAVEYGLMQAYGEGFELLHKSGFDVDLEAIARLWNHGSVIRSWLLELIERALSKDPKLDRVIGYVEDSGEGRWSVIDAVERGVPFPHTALALFARFRSRQEDSFASKVVAALRREFGGHAVRERG